jgi:spore coat polysaccharide biosynthesis protein SpsF
VNKFVLGGAQFGLAYGVNNKLGKPLQAISESLIKMALTNGILFIDTARSYGNSEDVIGKVLELGWEGRAQVITKLSPLLDCQIDSSINSIRARVDESINLSCLALRTNKLDVLLLHRASQLCDWSGAVWARMIEHKASGIIKALGVSVQSPDELEKALATDHVEFIQMPFNILDWRWDDLVSKIRKVKQLRKLTVHVRSALLQGLLISNSEEIWRSANVENPQSVMRWLVDQSCKSGYSSVAAFCLNYVISLDWVDGVVVGLENQEQLAENIRIFSAHELEYQQMKSMLVDRPLLAERTLNPIYWRK